MAAQSHLIKRQILELRVPQSEQTQSLYADIGRIYRQQIVPLIDLCCTDLSRPDHVHRIESLQLDLGSVNLKNLEEDLITRLREALPDTLAIQIRCQEGHDGRPEQSPRDQSRLELFEFFIRTGSLPWWADPLQPQLLSDVARHLIDNRPGGLVRVMRELARRQQPLQRLVSHSPDEILVEVCRLLAPYLGESLAQLPSELATLLQNSQVTVIATADALRKIIWLEILQTASLKGAQFKDPAEFWRAVLLQIALTSSVPYAHFVTVIHRAAQTGEVKVSGSFRDLAAALHRELQSPGSDREDLIGALERLQDSGGSLSTLYAQLQSIAGHWPNGLQAQLLSVLKRYEKRGSDKDILKAIIPVLKSALGQNQGVSIAAGRRLVNRLKLAVADLSPEISPELMKMLREFFDFAEAVQSRQGVPETPIDLSFSDADELYVNNCGLVILWPFLSSFFEHLGLMEDRQFKGKAAVQRAVGLLQYLATEDSSPPEFLLPLNKVLCGMDPTAVFDFGPPVTPDEAQECRNLLNAVITHAPVLKGMSRSGFQGTFLLRKGILATRDGSWLLRVERESYDVVLDRFPWSLEWIKLPWMETTLRVEW